MSATRLLQRIKELTFALQRAHDLGDEEEVITLEDEIYDLEDELEDEQQADYDDAHAKGWN